LLPALIVELNPFCCCRRKNLRNSQDSAMLLHSCIVNVQVVEAKLLAM
jgi:hypothetical protein